MPSIAQSTKTALIANVSTKLSSDETTVQLILRDIVSSRSTFITHVICGARGIGKTWTAHFVAQAPICKSNFSHGVIWLGLGMYKKRLDFLSLRKIYQSICAQLKIPITSNFEEIKFSKVAVPELDNSGVKREQDAMIKMKEYMAKRMAERNVLLCVDGLHDNDDIEYFEFHDQIHTFNSSFRLIVTTNDTPIEEDGNGTKVWHLTNYTSEASKSFFMRTLKPKTTEVPAFIYKYNDLYRICQGNPLSIKTLCSLLEDKLECKDLTSFDSFVAKFANCPCEPKIQIFNILEVLFTNSTLGESFNKITWRCFASFATVFPRNDCSRPCIGKSTVIALFQAVMKKVGIHMNLESSVEILQFLVKTKVLTQIDGYDNKSIPRTFYQISCDIYQEFGEQLSSSPETNMKLHQLFVNEYTTMSIDKQPSFGSKEIDSFMLKWLPHHLRQGGDLEDQAVTLPDYRFIQERINHFGTIDAVKRHIHDAESFVRMSSKGSKFLILCYETVVRILEYNMDNKEDTNRKSTNTKENIEAMWLLALSLLSHYHVQEGCQLVEKASEYDDKNDPVIDINTGIFRLLAEASMKGDHLQTVRSLIKIGTMTARSSNRKHEALNIILLGLTGLIHCLGKHSLEVARVHVYIGEVLYRDLKLYDDALDHFRASLPVLLKELGDDSEEVYDAIILCSKTYVSLGNLATALDILEKLVPQLKDLTEIEVRHQIASIYIMIGDLKSAYSILLKLRQRTNDPSLLKQISATMMECSNSQLSSF